MSNLRLAWRLLGAILWVPFTVFVFLPIYVICCPYFLSDNPAEEDYYNYINHLDMFL
jgi:hypothetical protein